MEESGKETTKDSKNKLLEINVYVVFLYIDS